MKYLATILAAGILALAGASGSPAAAQNVFDNVYISMVPSGGAAACIKTAAGRVTISPAFGQVENMHVELSGLPKNTDFVLFVIQVPTKPFGLSWYQGDLVTDSRGKAVQDFVGRFSIGTFIVAPDVAPAPKVLPDDATSNPKTAPVQLYHLGVWFNSPLDAGKAGCSTKPTPFNSFHKAGPQILNTSNSPTLFGPLRRVVDR
jgi:hypothetical protein